MILELPAELEARLKADAIARGITPEIVVVETVSARYDEPNETPEQRRARIKGAIESVQNYFSQFPSVGDFIEEKHADIARENARLHGDSGGDES